MCELHRGTVAGKSPRPCEPPPLLSRRQERAAWRRPGAAPTKVGRGEGWVNAGNHTPSTSPYYVVLFKDIEYLLYTNRQASFIKQLIYIHFKYHPYTSDKPNKNYYIITNK